MTLYVCLGIQDGMFPSACTIVRFPYPPGLAARKLQPVEDGETVEVVNACNPSHKPTLDALYQRTGIDLRTNLPSVAPIVSAQVGDFILVLSVRGLPDLGATRDGYTPGEIRGATFTFNMWQIYP